MNWYPQLQTGAVSQFPIRRGHNWRVISNEFEGGERLWIADTGGSEISWKLVYVDLVDSEVAAIRNLFTLSLGRYRSFGFADPVANFIAGSENLAIQDWRVGGMNTVSGIADPLGTNRAWRVENHTAGDQDLAQTLSFPASFTACFSAYVRASGGGDVRLRRDSHVSTFVLGANWRRISLSGLGNAGAATSDFGLRLSSGQAVEVWGLQVEAQPNPSKYQVSEKANGVYQQTHFAMDELRVTATSPGRSSCEVSLVSRI